MTEEHPSPLIIEEDPSTNTDPIEESSSSLASRIARSRKMREEKDEDALAWVSRRYVNNV